MMNLYRALVVIVAIFSLQACGPASAPIKEPAASSLISTQDRVIATLLRVAEDAALDNRLTSPLHDNASDRYRAVLMLDSDNAQARRGLAFIAGRYLEWAQASINQDDLANAAIMVAMARSVEPESAEANDLEDQIRKNAPRVIEQRSLAAREKEWPLDTAQLNTRHPQLISELGVLAERLKLSGETMLIVARNDQEGRWIYKQMRQAVTGYRLRGDIEMGQQPKIVIRPAI